MKIVTVCGMGFGTSLMVKMTIDDILNEVGFNAEVEASDIGSITGRVADLFVTSTEMQNQFSGIESDVIFLKNMTDKQEIREKLLTYLNHKAKR
ncbi:PTS system IIB component (L-Asc family) [Melghirimyces profundicolus]|uniref:PTS system IIB component (L-Asc family) n=1 Tax=Melghirimyces profundicolus TaxID=1242148 RepID=A0A2T6BD49_9BACL|nr:PTS sugar transporter subunit IIB [Melghirimyces profundicolus]PTX53993.1 PTS system IIB component (L-Asc family) [Melghirimyces profundicolus]